jgi:protein TonB
MIERAQPLPSMPDDMRRARLELVVPVRFFLR